MGDNSPKDKARQQKQNSAAKDKKKADALRKSTPAVLPAKKGGR